MKLFKADTTVNHNGNRTPSRFSDWYTANNEQSARELWLEDCHRYGVKPDQATVTFSEHNPDTLKPINS